MRGFRQGPARVGHSGRAVRLRAGELQTGPHSQARRSAGYYRRSVANAAAVARVCASPNARRSRPACDQPTLPGRGHRSARDGGRAQVPAAPVRRAELATYIIEENLPGPSVQSDDELLDYARSNGSTVYHASCSCMMGNHGMSVVDDQLRVHGLEALRIIDASVMPAVSSTNTNAPTIMIAEKGAAMIKASAPSGLAA